MSHFIFQLILHEQVWQILPSTASSLASFLKISKIPSPLGYLALCTEIYSDFRIVPSAPHQASRRVWNPAVVSLSVWRGMQFLVFPEQSLEELLLLHFPIRIELGGGAQSKSYYYSRESRSLTGAQGKTHWELHQKLVYEQHHCSSSEIFRWQIQMLEVCSCLM